MLKVGSTVISKNLTFKKGIWYSGCSDSISYPEQGNNDCYIVEDDSYWFNHRNALIAEVVRRFSFGKVFFDVGGGNGVVSKSLIDEGFTVYLVEPGPKGCLNAKGRGINNIINSTFEGANFKEGSLSNIGLFDVIEHIQFDRIFLNHIFKSTSNKGKLFITVPAYAFLWSDSDTRAGHYKRYSMKSILSLIESTGYKVLFFTYFFCFLVPVIFFFRTVPDLFLKKSDSENFKKDHISDNQLVNAVIDYMCRYEMRRIEKGRKIHFGGSILIVGEKS